MATKNESERLARMEGKLDMLLDAVEKNAERNDKEHSVMEARMDSFQQFRGRVIGGAIVGSVLITAIATIAGVLIS